MPVRLAQLDYASNLMSVINGRRMAENADGRGIDVMSIYRVLVSVDVVMQCWPCKLLSILLNHCRLVCSKAVAL